MEDYTFLEALANIVGEFYNPITQRKNPEIWKSAKKIKEYLDNRKPIDEDKLDELANEYVEGGWNHMDMASRRDFKAGYRKAKEE